MNWQKSSYCSEGNSCVHVAATPQAIHITESSDPARSILTTTPAAFATLLTALKTHPHPTHPTLRITYLDDGTVRLGRKVTTTRPKWDAFVLGVRAGEFDHFVSDDLQHRGALTG